MNGSVGRVPPRLVPCPGCRQFMRPSARRCPHCGGAVAALARTLRDQREKERRVVAEVERLIARVSRRSRRATLG